MFRRLPVLARSVAFSYATALFACANPTEPQGGEFDQRALIVALQGRGSNVTIGATVEQPFFPVAGHSLLVDGEPVQVFEFTSGAQAQAAASTIDPDGGGTATIKISWIAPPHFFRRGRVIALYVGSRPTLTTSLSAIMGAQFAGR